MSKKNILMFTTLAVNIVVNVERCLNKFGFSKSCSLHI
ncbi:hypothetical protein OIU77_001739 [Salix suchowensis]|uniref:Uncharacterized protein n=1 Tax=Salix suchowensis TaxID=1278906 RepID=A0ABQ9B4C8_9ROSI|nr:hypothetical protein OIU77_001739 [Salix suchowensis]